MRSHFVYAASVAAALAWTISAQAASTPWVTDAAAKTADTAHQPIALQFRRQVNFGAVPRQFFVDMSADNRFVLFVNGHRTAAGPARGDLDHWHVEHVDIAPYLRRGANVIAAEVWNDENFAPMAQITARTAFELQSESPTGPKIDTDSTWQVRVDRSRTVESGMDQLVSALGDTYYVAGPPETHDGTKRAWDWAAPVTQARDWHSAVAAFDPGQEPPWTLMPDPLPQMSYEPTSGGEVVRATGINAKGFPESPVVVPAHSDVVLLVDAGQVQAAYPELTISGGRGAEIQVTYAEALYGPDKQRLADRAQVQGGQMLGLRDTFLPDGSAHRTYEPFWWRVWRFVQIHVKTGDTPLRLERFTRDLTGYPFSTDAHFTSDDPDLNRIWQIGWNTVRLDAHETYMDSAYWEQLQYVGDTRLSVLTSYAVSKDWRLPVQAIEAIRQSNGGGLPWSRWPSRETQSIPPFALLWIGMMHDAWMYRPVSAVLQENLPTMRRTLAWYGDHIDSDGLVAATGAWDFVDWRPGLINSPGRSEMSGERCVITLLYIGALQQAADLEGALGDPVQGQSDKARAEQLADTVRHKCWSPSRGLFANDTDQKKFSQHANALAIIYDVAPKAEQAAILDRITVRNHGIDAPEGVTPTTYYFAFYLSRAAEHAGLADRYFEFLQTWRDLLAKHFTTWPETPDPSRSDTHAWSAHPTHDLLSLVAGIEPASPAFSTVIIRPHLGALKSLDAAMAHPNGLIETRYRRNGAALHADISLPAGISGSFEWDGQTYPLHPGPNAIDAAGSSAH